MVSRRTIHLQALDRLDLLGADVAPVRLELVDQLTLLRAVLSSASSPARHSATRLQPSTHLDSERIEVGALRARRNDIVQKPAAVGVGEGS